MKWRGVFVMASTAWMACGPPGDFTDLPDGGKVANPDGGTALGCVFPRADRITLRASELLAQPNKGAAVVEKLGANTVVIPLATGAEGSCPESGFYRVQERTERGWVLAADTGDALCTRGSAFDPGLAAVVRSVFGTHGNDAVAVSHCESGSAGTAAVNGPYYGLFQMGSSERNTYGDSICAEGESLAANTYFVATGSDWSPWTCRP